MPEADWDRGVLGAEPPQNVLLISSLDIIAELLGLKINMLHYLTDDVLRRADSIKKHPGKIYTLSDVCSQIQNLFV